MTTEQPALPTLRDEREEIEHQILAEGKRQMSVPPYKRDWEYYDALRLKSDRKMTEILAAMKAAQQ